METIKINNKNFKKVVKKTTDLIKSGKVVIFPTDTVYGLICDARNKKAVEKIFKIKSRPKNNPLPIFIKDIKSAESLAVVDKNQKKVIIKYWPGRVTFVLNRMERAKLYGQKKETIALRVPKYRFLLFLLKKLDFPLAQTSANVSGNQPITSADEAIKEFNKKRIKPDLVIDGGRLKDKSSKIIDLTVEPFKVLRP